MSSACIDDVVLASYFSDNYMFSFCYTINTLWSQPKKKIMKIKKSERIELEFYVDISDRDKNAEPDKIQYPKYVYPSSSSIQLAIHSPYVTGSPYSSGMGFLGGKRYQIKLKQEEKHLLPPPYQTNCTDYVSPWLARNGTGSLNQIMVIEECKYNLSLAEMGCVPFTVDYPHNTTVCRHCEGCQ
ncbi:uncharacterized protein LOC118196028, partial [Stegodyphus dumicola]|uniref:uncharacterized protein LOC118196028 n=1 Tax=Stegodyphus dumicola TaxID=202533 RepID=UPI0015AF23E6